MENKLKSNSHFDFYHKKTLLKSKCSQVAIFVIIALVIVGAIVGYFVVKDTLFLRALPAEFVPIYEYYTSCVEGNVKDGVSLLGTQAGYIELPEFEPGSEYSPFSNQLDFLGFGVPYWYYVSGNNIIKEQVPTKGEMESQLGDYLAERVEDCDFTEFKRQGFDVVIGEASASADINDNNIGVVVRQPLSIEKIDESGESQTVVINTHKIKVNSMFGKYYDIARAIYDYEKQEMFLENYAVDALYSYAPVTGTDISCSPLFWNPYNVIDDIKAGLAANIGVLKVQGDYYKLDNDDKGYHIVNPGFSLDSGEQVNFMYSGDWASRFEIWPTKGDVMMAKPVGASQGMSAAGFCYVSYKFVYDMFFPVMIQVSSGNNAEEVFQFPVAVVVSKNQPRQALEALPWTDEEQETVCDNANFDISIYTYDENLEPVEANLEFKCFTDVCDLGKTEIAEGESDAKLDVTVPQCVNGIIIANAEGYAEKEYLISTNQETIADVILAKEHVLELEVFVDSKLTNNIAVLTISENLEDAGTKVVNSIGYPYVKDVEIADGDYTFDLQVYTEKSITIPEDTRQECVDVPKKGLLGFFGAKDEECFDYTMPSQKVSHLMYAGGSQVQYVTQSELEGATKIKVYAESVDLPSTLEDIQKTYDIVDAQDLRIDII